MAGIEGKLVGDPEHRLGATKEEITVVRELPVNAPQDVALGRRVEVDQHVAAEHDVEHAERGEIVEQVELAEGDLAPNGRGEFPTVFRDFGEVLEERLDRQAALNLELRVPSRRGLGEDRRIDIRAEE